MLRTITQALQEGSSGPVALPLAFALGLVSALASACCTLPAMGMLAAYSGTRQTTDRRSLLTSAVWFLIGTTLALVILGFVAGLVGQAAQAFLGRYWKLFAGVVAVLLGLGTLTLLPLPALGGVELEGVPLEHVITVCDHARGRSPLFPGRTRIVHRGLGDPPRLARSARTELEALGHRRVCDEIRTLVAGLPACLPGDAQVQQPGEPGEPARRSSRPGMACGPRQEGGPVGGFRSMQRRS